MKPFADEGLDLGVDGRQVVLVTLEIELKRLRAIAEMTRCQGARLAGDGRRGEKAPGEALLGLRHGPASAVSRMALPVRAATVAASASRCALRPSRPVGASGAPSSTPATKASSSAR